MPYNIIIAICRVLLRIPLPRFVRLECVVNNFSVYSGRKPFRSVASVDVWRPCVMLLHLTMFIYRAIFIWQPLQLLRHSVRCGERRDVIAAPRHRSRRCACCCACWCKFAIRRATSLHVLPEPWNWAKLSKYQTEPFCPPIALFMGVLWYVGA